MVTKGERRLIVNWRDLRDFNNPGANTYINNKFKNETFGPEVL